MGDADAPDAADERAARLARAQQRHALTERVQRPPASQAARAAAAAPGAKVLGERPWAGNSTRAAAETGWEPMGPPAGPSSYGIASGNSFGYAAVFGLLAVYALIGAAGYVGGFTAIALSAAELAKSFT